MNSSSKKKILVAPLDWGLGHATRCIPIIQELLNAGYEVIIAAEGKIKILLLREFPYLLFLPLKGYRIKYGKTKAAVFFKIFFQVPKIIRAIRQEHDWLQKIVKDYDIDLVLSDNRYGLYHSSVPCILITHQLNIQTPFFSRLLQRLNYQYINRFTECWIPDDAARPGLAGALSHPLNPPSLPLRYLGPLSRFNGNGKPQSQKHLLLILSGPEPQRTILEEKLIAQVSSYSFPVLLIRGLPGEEADLKIGAHVTVVNHLTAHQLEEAMLHASMIISRSGYSSIMDIITLKKKSILIPTPGQTEQEYLAAHLHQNGLAYAVLQKDFRLNEALTVAASFPYRTYRSNSEGLKLAVQHIAGILSKC